jgi:Tfp pilus assembly protein PilF
MNLRTRTASRTGSLLLLVWLAAAPACRQDPAVVAAAFVASGDRYFTGRQYKAATLEYRNALEHQPQAAAIHRKLARAYDAAGQPRKALASLATVTGLVDNDSEANLRVSQALVATRRYKDARQLATRVQPGDPLYGDARIVVATAAASLGEAKAADGALAEALAIDSHSRAAHLLKASWQLRDRQVAAARRTLETLLRFHPDAADGWRALGALDWQAGATAAAEPSLRRALELSPDDAEIRRLFASYVIAIGRAPEAEVHLRAVAEKSSPDRLRLAAYYAALNRLDEAEREVTAIIARLGSGHDLARAGPVHHPRSRLDRFAARAGRTGRRARA